MTVLYKGFLKVEYWVKGQERRQTQILNDLTMNSEYVTVKQTAAERTM